MLSWRGNFIMTKIKPCLTLREQFKLHQRTGDDLQIQGKQHVHPQLGQRHSEEKQFFLCWPQYFIYNRLKQSGFRPVAYVLYMYIPFATFVVECSV
ncbi:unnamed protein product [Camellia sinensis]